MYHCSHLGTTRPDRDEKTRQKLDFNSTTRRTAPITGAEVLDRLKAAFKMDDWTGPPRRLVSHFADDEQHRSIEFYVGGRDDGTTTCATIGYRFYKAPTRNRRSHGLLDDPSKWNNPRLDRIVTRLTAEHDDPVTGKTFDLDALIKRTRETVLSRVRSEPSYWTRLCAIREAVGPVAPFDRNAKERALEALDWIVEVEDDCALERARQIVLCWLREGKTQRAFAKAKGLCRVALRRLIERYCLAIADRINAAGRPIIAIRRGHCKDGGHRESDVVRGVDQIAAVTRRKPASALRLIEGGKAPIATLDGEPVALRQMLVKWRSTSKARLAA